MPTKKLYAYLATDDQGVEGIITVHFPERGRHPLVALNRQTMEKMWPWARSLGLAPGVTAVRLVEFREFRDLDPDNLPPEDEG